MTTGELIALGNFVLIVAGYITATTWGPSKIRLAIAKEVDKHRAETDAKIDTAERRAGEMGAALRQKIHETDLKIESMGNWVRDNMEPKGASDRVMLLLADRLDRIDRSFERLDGKVDQVNASLHSALLARADRGAE